jgi:LmbE family N-acetylglucosaminyl deacetylase
MRPTKQGSSMSNSVLVVAAHPDDEVLGCGGTIARHVAAGDRIEVAFFTDGVGARHQEESSAHSESGKIRHQAALRAAEILGIPDPTWLGFPDNRLDSIDLLDLVRAVEKLGQRCRPTTVYTHWLGDLNIDHRLVCQAVMTAFRPMSDCPVMQIRLFEVPSSTEWGDRAVTPAFRPNLYVGIDKFLEVKHRALDAYDQEMRPFPHPRSHQAIEALARWRGAESGMLAAETFVTVLERCP